MHQIIVEPTHEGFRVCRPGWPAEFVDEAHLADSLAESLAYEFHALHGRPACAVRVPEGRLVACFI